MSSTNLTNNINTCNYNGKNIFCNGRNIFWKNFQIRERPFSYVIAGNICSIVLAFLYCCGIAVYFRFQKTPHYFDAQFTPSVRQKPTRFSNFCFIRFIVILAVATFGLNYMFSTSSNFQLFPCREFNWSYLHLCFRYQKKKKIGLFPRSTSHPSSSYLLRM